ncbi:MAG TPA: hypothetical protein VIY86_10515, partial [Pirellulaceae bacterium]
MSTLSVVTNEGWLIPYVACAYVGLGMLTHFLGVLRRFIERRLRMAAQSAKGLADNPDLPYPVVSSTPWTPANWILPASVLAILASVVVWQARPVTKGADHVRWQEFGRIPILFEGRAQPIDTLARNTLRIISNKQSYRELRGDETLQEAAKGPRNPAIHWLLDVIAASEEGRKQRVFKIDNLAVQNLLKVDRRKGALYSLDEIGPRLGELGTQAEEAQKLKDRDPTRLTVDQRKILEVADRLTAFVRVQKAFQPTAFPQMPSPSEQQSNPDQAQKDVQELAKLAMEAMSRARNSKSSGMPLIVPAEREDAWLPFGSAVDVAYLGQVMQSTAPSPWVVSWSRIVDAYAEKDWEAFDRSVAVYRRELERRKLSYLDLERIDFEAFFNHWEPLRLATIGYLLGF